MFYQTETIQLNRLKNN